MSLRVVMSCVILCLAIAAPLHAAPPSDTDLQAKVDAIAADYLAKPGAAGLSIGIARQGKVLLAKGYGLADVEFDVPANADTMFRIGSVTKQFTAAAIMRLVEQGKISLDDSLNKFLPDYPTQGHTVTIRHLLNHTSGIKSYTDVGEEWVKIHPLELTHEQLLALVKDRPFDFKPGEKWAYNNTAYYMLGMIIETISGKSYAQHMQDEFFTPLNLERTRYDISSDVIKNRAQGYTIRDGVLGNDDPLGMSQPFAAGSLLSTGEELVEWSMALTAGKVVKPESFALMTTPTTLADGSREDYGFGLAIDEFENQKRIQHGGGIHGFNSMLLWLPEPDLHVAVISNGEPIRSGKIADAIAYAVLGIEKAAVKDEPISPELLKSIVGMYTMEEPLMDVKVWEDGGTLMVKAQTEEQSAFRLKYQGAGASPDGELFRAAFDGDVTFTFAKDGRSFTVVQGGMRMAAKRVGE
jgi:D-alanyl-D-alanine carboxypeptidase